MVTLNAEWTTNDEISYLVAVLEAKLRRERRYPWHRVPKHSWGARLDQINEPGETATAHNGSIEALVETVANRKGVGQQSSCLTYRHCNYQLWQHRRGDRTHKHVKIIPSRPDDSDVARDTRDSTRTPTHLTPTHLEFASKVAGVLT